MEQSGPFLFKGRAGAGLPCLIPEAEPVPPQTRTQSPKLRGATWSREAVPRPR